MEHSTTTNPFVWTPESATTSPEVTNGPLAGLRLAVKDLFHIAGIPTTAGSPQWLATHSTPAHTSPCIRQLSNAGASFVGKTLTDELAYSLNGQNIHYDRLLNPITPDRLTGGSSSGSAVAVAAGLADIGLGTDTGGSIRVPASYNGLFGMRPTPGRISVEHMVGLATSFDTVGVLTRDLEALALSMAALLPQQPVWQPKATLIAPNLFERAAHTSLLTPVIDQWLAREKLATCETLSLNPVDWQLAQTFKALQAAEIWHTHGDWLDQYASSFAPDIQQRLEWGRALSNHEVALAKSAQTEFRSWMDNRLAGRFLILPTTPGLAPRLDTPSKDLADYRDALLELTAIAGLGGYPQLHLPVAHINGAPCGLSLLGPRNSDLALIAFAKNLME